MNTNTVTVRKMRPKSSATSSDTVLTNCLLRVSLVTFTTEETVVIGGSWLYLPSKGGAGGIQGSIGGAGVLSLLVVANNLI